MEANAPEIRQQKQRLKVEPGIYIGMPEDTYFAAEGLSVSGMKQLSVSPLNYWHHNLNPERVQPEETPQQRFGKALHCRVLEPDRFKNCYAVKVTADDLPGVLITSDDLKEWLSSQGLPCTAKRKQDLIDRVLAVGSHPPIWELESARLAGEMAGKVLLRRTEMEEIDKAATVLSKDQNAAAWLSGGIPEVSFFVPDPETGVMLKARMDFVKPKATVDLKSFSNSRGKSTDKVVFDAIYYEGYYLQAVAYQKIRELARQGLVEGSLAVHGKCSEAWLDGFKATQDVAFGFVFVESCEPFDLRLVQVKKSETARGEPNVYWIAGWMKMDEMTSLYAACLSKYGGRPWRDSANPHVLADADMPQLMFT